MSKHSSLKEILKDASKYKLQLAAVAAALFLLLISCFADTAKEEKAESGTDFCAREYIRLLESELENLLSSLEGAGEVKVMITLENGAESKYATQTQQKTENANGREEFKEEYVIVKKGASNEECIVISVSEPRVRGVAVAAQGADSPEVNKAITETVCAVFDISSADVSVEKMKYEKE